jgi:energy-coupling factor transporter ATP-binding protein EcfA2
MDLERYRQRSSKILSGGEKKKLLIACLLAVDPSLWLLDETLEELDGRTKSRLLELLQDRGRKRGCSTLILSAKWHALFSEYAQQVFMLEEGGLRPVTESPASPEFQRLLLDRGFELTERDRKPGSPPGGGKRRILLQAEDLHFQYQAGGADAGPAFSLDIDRLHLEEGRVLAVLGDNGSGKTTLGRILCGLLEPQQGRISIRKGGTLRPAGSGELNRFTGYLFQDPDLQIFLPTVADELSLGLRNMELPAAEISRRLEDTIRLFGLPAAQAPPSLMSYGARKKLQAGVYHLLQRPLMIIDEGDSGLSVNDFAEMVRIFRHRERALIFITHDHRLADVLADEVMELKSGRVA